MMDGEDTQTSSEVAKEDPKPDVALPVEGETSTQDPSTTAGTTSHSTAEGTEGKSSESISDGTTTEAETGTVDIASEKPSGADVADGISEGKTPSSLDKPLEESSGSDGPSTSVVSTTPNVVVEKVGGGLMTWNLTAAGGDGEGKETGTAFPLDLGESSTILTQDQILKIDAALKSEQIKSNPLLENPTQESMDSMAVEEPDDHQETEEKMQINIDSVLDIGPGSFSTKHLMNQVMSSEILMEAIGDDGLVAATTVEENTNDGESESGSTTDSTSEKKKEDTLKRRSARIAHITANDLTLRQAMREKEQKKKEREEKKRQKEEEKKAKESKNVTVVEEASSTPTPPEEEKKEETDLSSEIAKYLKVIDQQIKQSEAQEDPALKEDPVVKKEDEKEVEGDKEEEKKASDNLFDSLTKVKIKKETQEDTVKESTEGKEVTGKPDKNGPGTSNAKSNTAENNEGDAKDDMELGEVKEDKETGELSDDGETHHDSNSSVYWMDHSYAASPKVAVTSSVPTAVPTDSPTRRSSRRESKKAKSAAENPEEKKDEERPRRSSRHESKVSKEEENKEVQADKKSKTKHDHKDRKLSKEKKEKREKKEKDKSHSRSRSKERSSSKEKERHRRESRSKSRDDREKDKKKKKHKDKDKDKDESKTRKSSRSSREVKKTKLGDDELSDIPFSSEEEEEHEAEEGEHESGSDWTSDDDPEKLWCICRQPHDGKFMICCDKCEDWFHGKCVNITKKEGKRMEKENLSWKCPKCTEEEKNVTADKTKGKDDQNKKTEDVKEARSKEKERRKSRDRKREEVDEEEYGEDDDDDEKEEKKGRRGKVTEEKRRKRKSDAGSKKDSESKKEPEEEVASKKKRLKFFRPPPPKQHCIGTRCENWARSGSVYCSPGCIVKHAKESMRLLSAEKERATGLKARRDSAGGSSSSSTQSLKLREDERISVIERHTGRLRTGLTAPTYEELPYWLGRHPTYEVLRPNIKHGYTASSFSSGKGSSKHKPESRRLSHEGDSRNLSSSDSERKISTKQITSPNKDSPSIGAESLEKRQRERREKVRLGMHLLEMKRREEEAIERELERKRMEESRRKREEEKREEEERKKKEDERRRKEDRERREREKKEKEERLRLQAENSKLAEQTSESVRVNVKRTLLDVLLTRVKKAPDVKNVTADDVKRVSKQIEFELYKLFNDTGAKYKAKYRTLIFNIKDMKNKGLFRHILKGEISPRNLVRMSSDQLASQELMKWREQEAKHELDMIVQTEKDKKSMHVTIVKKTHKGEVELGEEDNLGELVPHAKVEEETSRQSNRSSPVTELKSPNRLSFGSPTGYQGGSSPTTPTSPTTPKIMLIDTTEQHKAHLFDLNCKICTGKILAPQEEKVSKKKAIVRKTPKIIKKVVEEKKKGGVVKEKPVKFFGEEIEEKKPKVKSVTEDLYDDLMETVGGGDDDDDDDDEGDENAAVIIREPVDEARTPPGSPTPPVVAPPASKPIKEKKASKPSQVKRSVSSTAMTSSPAWRGFIFMHEVSKFVAIAHHVSGPAHSIPMDLQDTLEVCGRIPYKVVWDYFTKLKQSQSTEMTIMRFHVWQEDEEQAYFALFDYFYTRQRIGVIGKNRPHVKDFYLLALPSTDKVPQHILPFSGPGLPSNRPHMLLGIVIRHKDKQRSMSLDGELASKPIHQPPREPPSRELSREPPVHHAPKRKHHQPDITPPENTMSSFRSNVPSMKEISDLMTPKDVYPKTREMYVTEDQLVDPIVAQYANADPKELEVELEEPYSPTREEREAPYDPSDPTDDWIQGRSMPPSAVIPEPAQPIVPQAVIPEEKEVAKADVGAESGVKASDIASVAADASQNLLSAFSEQSGLSEQQQLLIQLTKQVEEAKKALLDRQIESLQSEINKATGKLGKTDEQTSDEAGTSPDVRLAQADSSTMTPKDDVTSTPGGPGADVPQGTSKAEEEEQPLCPPPNLPPFAMGAMLWNVANPEAAAHKQSPNINQPQPQVTPAVEGIVGNVATCSPASSTSQTWNQDLSHHHHQQQHHPPMVQSEQQAAYPPRQPGPLYSQNQPHSQPAHHPHSSGPHPGPPHQPGPLPPREHPQAPFQGPPPSISHRPPVPHHPPIPRPALLPPRPPGPQQHLIPQHPPPAAPPVTKKRKLEPPPPGEEGWKYGDDEEGELQDERREDSGPRIDQRSAPDRHSREDIDYRRDVDMRDDRPREAWAREHWERGRRGGRKPWPKQDWGPKGDQGMGRGYEDWSSREYSDRDDSPSYSVDYQHRPKDRLRMSRDSPISRDYGHRGRPR